MIKRRFIYFTILLSSSLLTVLHLKRLQGQTKEQQHLETFTEDIIQDQERFISYFPHGDFFEQLEALKVGLRIAQSTNRTLIAPQLILGKNDGWAPFQKLSKRYEQQDKSILNIICNNEYNDTLLSSPFSSSTSSIPLENRIDIELCDEMNNWTEIPWSSLFNMAFLERHQVKMIDRMDHQWKSKEGSEMTILDPLTFLENGTTTITATTTNKRKQQQKQKQLSFKDFSKDWKKWFNEKLYPVSSDQLKKPLSHIKVFESHLRSITTKYIQLGSLSRGSAYPSIQTEKQMDLMQQLSDEMVPNHLDSLQQLTNKIIAALGGEKEYISYHLHMNTVAKTEIDIRKANALLFQNHQWLNNVKLLEEMEKEKEENENNDNEKGIVTKDDPMSVLDNGTLLDLVNAIVFEILGDMPINQAVSASFPIQPSSLLEQLNNKNDNNNGSNDVELLQACVDYRINIDPLYPIVYLVTDIPWDSNILKPLNDFFPCLFTKNDFKKWNIIQTGWALNNKMGLYDVVDYDEILSPFLDILIAINAYSFLETPITPTTKFVSRQHHKL
ncbi:hypothetical protein BJ944DRAFT_290998 [Cunninghamella echinulata]|nr:hypothetical protein BJ944DRAFT_290998 [Cunninghamella echinulata]